jgi:hypothetical protein
MILEIASRRLREAIEQFRWIKACQHSEWTTIYANEAHMALNLANADMVRVRVFAEALDQCPGESA